MDNQQRDICKLLTCDCDDMDACREDPHWLGCAEYHIIDFLNKVLPLFQNEVAKTGKLVIRPELINAMQKTIHEVLK